MTPLKSMANASTPDAQTIAIQPFDKTCARAAGGVAHARSPTLARHVAAAHAAAPPARSAAAPCLCLSHTLTHMRTFSLRSAIKDIERALMTSDLGLTPSNDGNIIRLTIPQLTQDRRKELTKLVGKLTEDGKIALRNVRRDALKALEKLEKDKALSEDQLTAAKDAMQKVTDGCARARGRTRVLRIPCFLRSLLTLTPCARGVALCRSPRRTAM
jgi:ribosome recycling factor